MRANYGGKAQGDALIQIRYRVWLLRGSNLERTWHALPSHTQKVKNLGVVQVGSKSILSSEVELKICEHVQAMYKSMYGLTPTQVCCLRYG